MQLEDLFTVSPYSYTKEEKEKVLTEILLNLTLKHYENCPEYQKILDVLKFDKDSIDKISDLPFIPVKLFKEYDLISVPKETITKVLTSSGTSGQKVSRISLDATNVKNQTKTLSAIMSSFIGKKRLPLLLLDSPMVKKDRSMYSARGAGIIGFSLFGRNIEYALDDEMKVQVDKVASFLESHKDQTILMFGYTYMIWKFVVRALEDRNISFKNNNIIMFHIGGWKKLKNEAVDALEFNQRVKIIFGNVEVYNYYGMAEQLGSVFVQCEHGHFHCSNYSDVIIRRSFDFSEANVGEKGLIELVSVLPTSYPGHAILTEDEGEILGIDDCPCGRKGKYFKIHGRVKNAEVRGCSDTYEKH